MRKVRHGGWWSFALSCSAAFLLLAPACLQADLQELSNAQLSEITGSGFSSFTVDGDRVRAEFGVQAQTFTQIESLKMGYWDDGGGMGWDQNWTQVQLGTPDQDMCLKGFFIEALFENLSDPANRRLTGVYFGFNQVSGDLRADFQSLSRIGVNGTPDERRLDPGPQTFYFNDSELRISFELEGEHRGIWVLFGEGTSIERR